MSVGLLGEERFKGSVPVVAVAFPRKREQEPMVAASQLAHRCSELAHGSWSGDESSLAEQAFRTLLSSASVPFALACSPCTQCHWEVSQCPSRPVVVPWGSAGFLHMGLCLLAVFLPCVFTLRILATIPSASAFISAQAWRH